MATLDWYVRTGGSNLNGGSSDTDAAKVTRDSGTPGTVAALVFTDAGATFVTSGVTTEDALNIQVAGVDSIYEITSVDSETQLTLVAGPADGSYNYRIGGARAGIQKTVNIGAGNNLAISSQNRINIQTGTYTENAITPSIALIFIGNGGLVTIDGTGGAAGSDCVTATVAMTFIRIKFTNAVDDGFASASGNVARKMIECQAVSNGGDGITCAGNTAFTLTNCVFRSNTATGYTSASTVGTSYSFCQFSDNGSHGVISTAATSELQGSIIDNLIFDNGGDGISCAATTSPANAGGGQEVEIRGNTIEGNTGDGIQAGGASGDQFSLAGSSFYNNIISNNGGWGITCPTQVSAVNVTADYNIYFQNDSGDRNNFLTGANDQVTDPKYVNAGSDDYTPGPGSPAIRAGNPFFTGNNKVNIGAVGNAAGGGGSFTFS